MRAAITYTKTNSSHSHHGQDIQPGKLEPLAKAGPRVHRVRLVTAPMATTAKSPASSRRRRRRIVGGWSSGPRRGPSSASKESHSYRFAVALYKTRKAIKGNRQQMILKEEEKSLGKAPL